MFVQNRDGVYLDYYAGDSGDLLVPPQEFIGKNMRDVLPDEIVEEALGCFERAHLTGEPQAMEYSLKLGEDVKHYEARITYTKDDEFLSIVREITDRKRAERDLIESQKRYCMATTAGGVGVWDYDLLSGKIYLDPQLKAMLGFEDSEIRNHIDDWSERIHPDDREIVMRMVDEHLAGAIPAYEVEHRMVAKDGSSRWFLSRGSAVRRDDGTPYRLVGTDTDITERKQAEEEAHAYRELLQLTIDSLSAHIAILDERSVIIAVNESWRRFGRGDKPWHERYGVGLNYLEVCDRNQDSPDARKMAEGLRSVLSGERDYFSLVYYCQAPQGPAWFIARVTRFAAGDAIRLVVAHENVTEVKRTEDALRRLTGRLLHVQDTERRRIARDLHDATAQNLVALLSNLSLLRRSNKRMGEKSLGIIAETIALGEEVLKEIRTLSYLLHPPQLDHTGLADAIHWFADGYSKRSRIKVDLDIRDVGRLPADIENAMFRVVQESLVNVSRHSGSQTATITLARDGDKITLRVEDRGCGIDSLPNGDSTDIHSLGVGIPGMRERIRQLGGDLLIHSSPAGTVVEAIVPI
jgi:PAS domain S-box-containing protein